MLLMFRIAIRKSKTSTKNEVGWFEKYKLHSLFARVTFLKRLISRVLTSQSHDISLAIYRYPLFSGPQIVKTAKNETYLP